MYKYIAIALMIAAVGTTAVATDVQYYSGPLSYHNGPNPPIAVGTITATMHYTNENDATLEVKYDVSAGLTKCNLWVDIVAPAVRVKNNDYDYHSGDINTTSHSFNIPIADLRTLFGIDWGSDVYLEAFCAYTGGSNDGAFGGTIIKPAQGAWFGYFGFVLTKPEEEPRQLLNLATKSHGYWKNHAHDAAWYPVTLAGEYISNETEAKVWLSQASGGSQFKIFMHQFVGFYCNRMSLPAGSLDEAYYDDPAESGEYMENEQVYDIWLAANALSSSSSDGALEQMKDVLEQINCDGESALLNVLWDGPAGRPVSLGQTARLAVYPNPFTGRALVCFGAKADAPVTVSVFDATGRKVRDLTATGDRVVWDGTDTRGRKLGAGVYLLKLVSGTETATLRAVISR